MALTFQPVRIDADTSDAEATLVFRNGRLLAVLSCLGDIHGDLAGQWFVEVSFGPVPLPQQAHETLESFEASIGSEV